MLQAAQYSKMAVAEMAVRPRWGNAIFVTEQISCLYLWQTLYNYVMPGYDSNSLLRTSNALRIKLVVTLILSALLRTMSSLSLISRLSKLSGLASLDNQD